MGGEYKLKGKKDDLGNRPFLGENNIIIYYRYIIKGGVIPLYQKSVV